MRHTPQWCEAIESFCKSEIFNLILQLLDEVISLLILVLKVSSSNSSIQNRESQRLVSEVFRKKLVHHLVCDTLLLGVHVDDNCYCLNFDQRKKRRILDWHL